MKVAIMQPYFLPYIGYFQLINAVDEFILFDTPQFIRHGWIERNYILKLNGDSCYIKVPLVKQSRNTSIKDMKINNSTKWQNKILAQLTHYKKKAPYYKETISLLSLIFKEQTDSIVNLNFVSLNLICEYLDITTPIKIWSEMNIEIDQVNAPDEWALNICKKINASTYINPIGGQSFFNKHKYIKSDIKLKFIDTVEVSYSQFDDNFTPWLSIIDILMFNSKDDIKKMVEQFNFLDK
jgi:hypothetical protein